MKIKKKQDKSFLQKHYSLSWLYIKECRNYILFVIFVFLVGFILALNFQPADIVELIKEFIERILRETEGLSAKEMVIYILDNNLKNSFFAMLLGVFLGVFPFFVALTNGYVLGFVAEKIILKEGVFILWRLFPHGIFEFPAVVLALALGLKLGFFWFAKEKKEKRWLKKEFFRRLESSLRVFLFVVLPLLVIASIIEGILVSVLG